MFRCRSCVNALGGVLMFCRELDNVNNSFSLNLIENFFLCRISVYKLECGAFTANLSNTHILTHTTTPSFTMVSSHYRIFTIAFAFVCLSYVAVAAPVADDGHNRKLAVLPAVRLIGSDRFENKNPNCWPATVRCLAGISCRHCCWGWRWERKWTGHHCVEKFTFK